MSKPYSDDYKTKFREAFPGAAVDEEEEKAKADLLKPDPEEAEATLKKLGIDCETDFVDKICKAWGDTETDEVK